MQGGYTEGKGRGDQGFGLLRASMAAPQIISEELFIWLKENLDRGFFLLIDSASSSWSFPGGKMTISRY